MAAIVAGLSIDAAESMVETHKKARQPAGFFIQAKTYSRG